MHKLKFLNPFFYVGILLSPLVLALVGVIDGLDYIMEKLDRI